MSVKPMRALHTCECASIHEMVYVQFNIYLYVCHKQGLHANASRPLLWWHTFLSQGTITSLQQLVVACSPPSKTQLLPSYDECNHEVFSVMEAWWYLYHTGSHMYYLKDDGGKDTTEPWWGPTPSAVHPSEWLPSFGCSKIYVQMCQREDYQTLPVHFQPQSGRDHHGELCLQQTLSVEWMFQACHLDERFGTGRIFSEHAQHW